MLILFCVTVPATRAENPQINPPISEAQNLAGGTVAYAEATQEHLIAFVPVALEHANDAAAILASGQLPLAPVEALAADARAVFHGQAASTETYANEVVLENVSRAAAQILADVEELKSATIGFVEFTVATIIDFVTFLVKVLCAEPGRLPGCEEGSLLGATLAAVHSLVESLKGFANSMDLCPLKAAVQQLLDAIGSELGDALDPVPCDPVNV